MLLASLAPIAGVAGASGAAAPGRVSVEGTLELEISDEADANGRITRATSDYWVRDSHGRRTRVTFAGEPPAVAQPGAKVRLTGRPTANGVAADGAVEVLADAGSTATQAGATSAAVAAAGAPVTKRLAVILVNFASNPVQPYTASYANGVIFTNTSSVAAFYAEDSYGSMALTGDVWGWFTINYDTSTCDTAAIQSKADAAATAAGVVLSGYTNVSYIFPHINACSFAGRAQLPGSRSWINTISATTPKIHDWVIAHELGHNFGVHHASSYSCTEGGARVPLAYTASNCTSSEYGDPLTVMGASNPIARYPHHEAWQRLQMGFMGTQDRRDVSVSGIYTLGAMRYAASAPKSLRIDRGNTATRHWFELEFRQPDVLFDGFASTAPVANGASIRLVADDTVRTQSWLIDTTPSTSSFSDAPLAIGKTFTDPQSGIAITTLGFVTDAAGHKALKVKVLFPNTPPPTAPADFTATSSNDGLTATLSWTVAATPVGVALYRVYRDEVLLGTVDGLTTTYTDPDRTPGASYSYRVEAVDRVDLVGASATTSVLMRVPAIGTTTASFRAGAGTAALAAGDTWTRAATIRFDLHFSAPVTAPTSAALTLSGTATGCAVAGVTGSGTDYTVSVTGCSEGTVVASITAGTVWDDLGYLAPAADAASASVNIDRTAPVASKPAAKLREGSRLSGTSVPVRITVGATDLGSGVVSYDVARSVDAGTYATVSSATTSTSFDAMLAPGHSYRYRVRSRDAVGNVSAWVEGVLLKPGLTQQTSSSVTYRGTWYTGSLSSYSGGSARYTKSSTASASYTFTGRGIALVTTQGSGRGKVKVYIDGVYVRTVDLYRSSASYRVLAFTQTFASSGTHTIKLVGMGTAGRPRVDLDAFAVVR